MRGETGRKPPWRDGMPHLFYPFLPVYVDKVDGKLHEERVDRFAGHDPQPRTGFQPFMTEQTDTPLRARIRKIHGISEDGIAGLIPYQDFQVRKTITRTQRVRLRSFRNFRVLP